MKLWWRIARFAASDFCDNRISFSLSRWCQKREKILRDWSTLHVMLHWYQPIVPQNILHCTRANGRVCQTLLTCLKRIHALESFDSMPADHFTLATQSSHRTTTGDYLWSIMATVLQRQPTWHPKLHLATTGNHVAIQSRPRHTVSPPCHNRDHVTIQKTPLRQRQPTRPNSDRAAN